MTKRGHWQIATAIRCSLRWKIEIRTIGFPAISCGAYGYPIEEAAHIAFKTTREFLAVSDEIQKVIFVVWGEDVYDAYRRQKSCSRFPAKANVAFHQHCASHVQRQHFTSRTTREKRNRAGIRFNVV